MTQQSLFLDELQGNVMKIHEKKNKLKRISSAPIQKGEILIRLRVFHGIFQNIWIFLPK